MLDRDTFIKRVYAFSCCFFSLPFLILYTFIYVDRGMTLHVIADAITIGVMLIALYLFKTRVNVRPTFYAVIINIIALFSFKLFYIHTSNDGMLWSFVIPLTFFFILGTKKGFYVVGGHFLLISSVLLFPTFFGAYEYSENVRLAFLLSMGIFGSFSFFLEYLREKSNVNLMETNLHLEEALKNIKTLSGLIPICSHCKNIRDDRGFWNQIELYISNHSEAKFSHGICPGCMSIHYPDIKIKKPGKL